VLKRGQKIGVTVRGKECMYIKDWSKPILPLFITWLLIPMVDSLHPVLISQLRLRRQLGVRWAEKYYVWNKVRNPLNRPFAHKFRATYEQLKLHNLRDSGHLGPHGLIPRKLEIFVYLHALTFANIMHTWIDFHQQIIFFSGFSYMKEINTGNLRKPKAPAAWVANQKW